MHLKRAPRVQGLLGGTQRESCTLPKWDVVCGTGEEAELVARFARAGGSPLVACHVPGNRAEPMLGGV